MTVYKYLEHALRIMRTQPDIQKWPPLIDALTPEQQAECRPWLREQARLMLRRARQQGTSVIPIVNLREVSTKPRRR